MWKIWFIIQNIGVEFILSRRERREREEREAKERKRKEKEDKKKSKIEKKLAEKRAQY